jgi:hypothetical protein
VSQAPDRQIGLTDDFSGIVDPNAIPESPPNVPRSLWLSPSRQERMKDAISCQVDWPTTGRRY